MKRMRALMLALLIMAACGTADARTESEPVSQYQFIPVEAGEAFVWSPYGTAPENEALATSIQAGMLMSGRDVYGLGLTACAVDPFFQYACVLVEKEDVLQLTILEKTEDDLWVAVACNDTIPAGNYDWESLRWAQSAVLDEETNELMTLDTGRFRISKVLYSWEGIEREDRSTLILDVARDDAGVWRVYAVKDVQFDQAVLGSSPYLTWEATWGWTDEWVLRKYTISKSEYNWMRSECRGEAVLTEDDMAGRDVVNDFDYPAFMEFLRAFTPSTGIGPLGPDSISYANTKLVNKEKELIAAAERMASLLAEEGVVYYNPAGGPYYHASMICESVDVVYWPMSPISIGNLNDPEYICLSPCPVCGEKGSQYAFVYYNPLGGKYYHSTSTCAAVDERYWPLTAIFYDMLNDPAYSRLMPCPRCNPPERPAAREPEELPDFVYYNPDGGKYYHAVEDCASVSPQFLPLTPIPFDQLSDQEYARLVPCAACNPPWRPILTDDGANEENAD